MDIWTPCICIRFCILWYYYAKFLHILSFSRLYKLSAECVLSFLDLSISCIYEAFEFHDVTMQSSCTFWRINLDCVLWANKKGLQADFKTWCSSFQGRSQNFGTGGAQSVDNNHLLISLICLIPCLHGPLMTSRSLLWGCYYLFGYITTK